MVVYFNCLIDDCTMRIVSLLILSDLYSISVLTDLIYKIITGFDFSSNPCFSLKCKLSGINSRIGRRASVKWPLLLYLCLETYDLEIFV